MSFNRIYHYVSGSSFLAPKLYSKTVTKTAYSVKQDEVFRFERRHHVAAFRSDDYASGPMMSFLTDSHSDFVAMYALLFWQEVERFRESFPTMQNSDKILTMTAILSKYVTNRRASELIPGQVSPLFSI